LIFVPEDKGLVSQYRPVNDSDSELLTVRVDRFVHSRVREQRHGETKCNSSSSLCETEKESNDSAVTNPDARAECSSLPRVSALERLTGARLKREDTILLIAYDLVYDRANTLVRECVVPKMDPDAQSHYVSHLKYLIPHDGIAHERNPVINGLLGALQAALIYKQLDIWVSCEGENQKLRGLQSFDTRETRESRKIKPRGVTENALLQHPIGRYCILAIAG